mmetsp:Transcript_7928/g.19442  ORF Transcript_7928/g.19442 Transcript_7928/m.19442 type:complete len:248 (-) Transcript_7928:636-1379(-)
MQHASHIRSSLDVGRRLAVLPDLPRRHHNVFFRQHKQARDFDVFGKEDVLEPPHVSPHGVVDEGLRPQDRRNVPLACVCVDKPPAASAQVEHQHGRVKQHNRRDALRGLLDHPADDVAAVRVPAHHTTVESTRAHRVAHASHAPGNVGNVLRDPCRHKRYVDEQHGGPRVDKAVHDTHVGVQADAHPVKEDNGGAGLLRVPNPKPHRALALHPLEPPLPHGTAEHGLENYHREYISKQIVVLVGHWV